jgi:hypothetical protein
MRLHPFHASELNFEDHTLANTLDRRRLLIPPGCYLVELLFARRPERPHRRFLYFVYVWEPATNRHYRFGISAEDHDTDWAVRQSHCRDMVRLTCTGLVGMSKLSIEVFPPPFIEDGIPRLLAHEWVQPLEDKEPLRIPFIIEPGRHSSARLLVVGTRPSSVFDEADFSQGYAGVRSKNAFVDCLYHRRRFQAFVEASAGGKPGINDLAAFQYFMSGCPADFSMPTNSGDFIREALDMAPYPVVYSWLSSIPSKVGERVSRRSHLLGTAAQVSPFNRCDNQDDRLAMIFSLFKPQIIVVHGNIPVLSHLTAYWYT